MNMKKLWMGLAVLAMVAGCTPKESSVGAPEGSASREEMRGKLRADRLVIAVLPKGTVHEFWLTVKAGAEAAGAESATTESEMKVWRPPVSMEPRARGFPFTHRASV